MERRSIRMHDRSRRRILGAGLLAAGSAIAARVTRAIARAAPVLPSGRVAIVPFDASGKPGMPVQVDKVVKTEAEWKKQLSPIAFTVARRAGTERPFTGATWNNHADGLYRCVCCDNAVYDSRTQFESGTGWPSFWQPIARENVRESRDTTFMMVRTAVSCTRCDAHLGHVFDDGPEPTGLRHCMNSAALAFVARA